MVERDFETQLERMFAQAAPMPDADEFTARVEKRLRRDWRVRTLVIGVAGVAGGAVAVSQSLGLGLGHRAQAVAVSSTSAFNNLYDQAAAQGGALLQGGAGVGMFWIASALMIVAAIVGATRALDES
ncbi:MAG: hypothetical protein JSR45_15095 [Proteobacteria bacterium]|nr:hypothetical protein [Pseudomonadota bacterium]